MSQLLILVQNIGAMFLVICVGLAVRKAGYLRSEASELLSKLVVDITLPCLVIAQMLRTVTWDTWQEEWPCIVLGSLMILVPYLAAVPFGALFVDRKVRPTFYFLVAMPNWIYLPLPIVKALYGDAGVRILLLSSAGVQLTLWSFGVWILRGRQTARQALKGLAGNVGLWATVAGIAIALALPVDRAWAVAAAVPAKSAGPFLMRMVMDTIEMIGSLTIPMSLLAIGVQLGGFRFAPAGLSRPMWGVVALRLLIAPVVIGLLGALAQRWGLVIPQTTRMVGYLVATMPVAISCSVMAERYEGDALLAAQSIFWSTFLSLATVPALFYLAGALGI